MSYDRSVVIGCNATKVDADATIICDSRLFRQLTIKHDPLVIELPVIINEKCNAWLSTRLGIQARSKIKVLDVYTPPRTYTAISSAHTGTLWAIEKGYTEIHVWGCDSIEKYTMESETDKIVDAEYKTKDNINKIVDIWRSEWALIINNNPMLI